MKLVIDIPKEEYEYVQLTGHIGNATAVSNAIDNGTPVPEDIRTNGDIMKTLFPDAKWWVNEDDQVFTEDFPHRKSFTCFDLNWWNSPYGADKEQRKWLK